MWEARISIAGKRHHLGYFEDEAKAAEAVDARCAALGRPQHNRAFIRAMQEGTMDSVATSRYTGVRWLQSERLWLATYSGNGGDVEIGRFTSEKDAAKAVDFKYADEKGEPPNGFASEAGQTFKTSVADRWSRYKGVSWSKGKNRWRAHIGVKGKQQHLGYFKDEWAAAEAYDKKATEIGRKASNAAIRNGEVTADEGGAATKTSKYTGVTWDKTNKTWQARMRVNRRVHHLGTFDDEAAAAAAYDAMCERLGRPSRNWSSPGDHASVPAGDGGAAAAAAEQVGGGGAGAGAGTGVESGSHSAPRGRGGRRGAVKARGRQATTVVAEAREGTNAQMSAADAHHARSSGVASRTGGGTGVGAGDDGTGAHQDGADVEHPATGLVLATSSNAAAAWSAPAALLQTTPTPAAIHAATAARRNRASSGGEEMAGAPAAKRARASAVPLAGTVLESVAPGEPDPYNSEGRRSRYDGVAWNSAAQQWCAYLDDGDSRVVINYFASEAEAHAARVAEVDRPVVGSRMQSLTAVASQASAAEDDDNAGDLGLGGSEGDGLAAPVVSAAPAVAVAAPVMDASTAPSIIQPGMGTTSPMASGLDARR